MPFSKKLLYALGQFAVVLCGYGALKLFSSFYIYRGFSGEAVFPAYLYTGTFFGLFTAAALILASSRIFEISAALFAGWFSDRSKLRTGRRTGFMRFSALPLALSSVLMFFPPSGGHTLVNTVFVSVAVASFFLFLACYTVPYLALLSGPGLKSAERLHMSVLMALASALATILGSRVFILMEYVSRRFALDDLASFQAVMGCFGLISFICLLLPALFIDEQQCCGSGPVEEDYGKSAGIVLRDRNFYLFLFADFMYRIASALIMSGFARFLSTLSGLPPESEGRFNTWIFILTLVLYVPVWRFARRFGKRKVLLSGFLILLVDLAFALLSGRIGLPDASRAALLSALFAFPLSVFTVLPWVIVADLAAASEKKTGRQRGGVYFGLHAFTSGSARLLVALAYPLLLTLGVNALIAVSTVCVLAGLIVFYTYREKEVAVILD